MNKNVFRNTPPRTRGLANESTLPVYYTWFIIEYAGLMRRDGFAVLSRNGATSHAPWVNTGVVVILFVVYARKNEPRIEIAATSSNPAGAIVRLIITVWNLLKFFFRNFGRMLDLITGFVGSFLDMAKGAVGAAAGKIEMTLARFIPLAIDLLLSIIGLGDLPKHIINGIKTIRGKIEAAIGWIAAKLGKFVKPVFDKIRMMIVRGKAFVGKGIRAVKGKVEAVKEKGKELLEKGKKKVTGFFREKWNNFRDAIANRHATIGKNTPEAEKKKQSDGIFELEDVVAGFEKAPEPLDKINDRLAALKQKYGFSKLVAVVEEKQVMVRFGFSEEQKVVTKLPWFLKLGLDAAGEPGKKIGMLIERAGGAIDAILDHPIDFLKNLGTGVYQGVIRFKDNFANHLKSGIFTWLSHALDRPITPPAAFDAKGVLGVVLQVFSLGADSVKRIFGKSVGQDNADFIWSVAQGKPQDD